MGKQALSLAAAILASASAATAAEVAWTGATDTDWATASNWDGGAVPVAGDAVTIPSGVANMPILAASTPALDSITISGTLTFTNWTTCLSATTVTIPSGGIVTCAGPFTDADMSNRVWIACTDLTLASGGQINVNEKGYGSTANGTSGFGPGKALSVTGGAAHGGHGGYNYAGTGTIYGDAVLPVCPGSSGASKNTAPRLAGGGAVLIEASGTVTVNGSITANGSVSSSTNNSGAGSGGSILILSRKIVASGGSLSAEGGRQGNYNYMRAGGGGRIALHYDSEVQTASDLVTLTVSAAAGGQFRTYGSQYVQNERPYNNHADIGTVYFTDSKPLKFLGTSLTGQIYLGSGASYSCDSITMTSGWVRFAQEGFSLTVAGDVTVNGTGARLDVGGGTYQMTGQTARYRSGTTPWSFTVGGDVTVSNGGRMELFAAGDAASSTATGGVLSVAGDITLTGTSSLYLSCDSQYGNAPLVSAKNVSVGANAVVSAEYRGFGASYGPGKGLVTDGNSIKKENTNWMIGAGHGGAGNRSRVQQSVLYGAANDDETRPVLAGSGGNQTGGDVVQPIGGGGIVHLVAQNAMTIDGKVSADSFPTNTLTSYGRVGCGAGGTVLLESKTFAMGSGAAISANGSSATQAKFYNAGVSGGGRIAIWTGDPYVDGVTRASAITVSETQPAAWLGTFSAGGGYFVDSNGAYRKYSEEGGWETTAEKSEATVRGGDGTIRFVSVQNTRPTMLIIR